MQIYLVGGAVRDQLLNLPVKERDWVVVGATETEMLAQGFVKVGKDFPVFLHPTTHEEYALARTERKSGKGYYGFDCYAAPDVTLEQDLLRRDLTINAMAQDEQGHIIDPYHGQDDIQQKLLRHISPAFSEDPVRILRVARFAARFAPLGFHVAESTNALMQQMVKHGEVDELVAERVWQEWQRSLTEKMPAEFLLVLDKCDALKKLFPSLAGNIDEIISTLSATATHTSDPIFRFVATMLDTDPATLNALFERYRIPNEYRDLTTLMQQYYTNIIDAMELSAEALLTLLTQLDAWRRSERFQQVLDACVAIAPKAKTAVEKLKKAYTITAAIKPTEFVQQGMQGSAIQTALKKKRLAALMQL